MSEARRAPNEPRTISDLLDLTVVGYATAPVRLGDGEDRGSVQVSRGTEKSPASSVVQLQISNNERDWVAAPSDIVVANTVTGEGIITTFVAGANLSYRLAVTTAESDRKARVVWVIRRASAAVLSTGEGVAR